MNAIFPSLFSVRANRGILVLAMLLGICLSSGCTSSGGSSGSRLPPDPVHKETDLHVEAYRSYLGQEPLENLVIPPALDAQAPSSGSHSARLMIDNQPQTYWESDGSFEDLRFSLFFGAVEMEEDMFGFIVDTSCLDKDEYRAIHVLELTLHEERLPDFEKKRSLEDDIHIPGEEVFIHNLKKIRLMLEKKASRQVFFLQWEDINPDDRNRLVVEAKVTGWYPGEGDETCLSEFHPFLQKRDNPQTTSPR